MSTKRKSSGSNRSGFHSSLRGAPVLKALALSHSITFARTSSIAKPSTSKVSERDEASKDLFFACVAFVFLLAAAVADLAFRF